MKLAISVAATAVTAFVAFLSAPPTPAAADGLKVIADDAVTSFRFPETVAYDPNEKVFYVSEFGSELMPTGMDGKGRISKVSLDGKVLDRQFLPTDGQKLNKPKGMWIDGDRLWVTDIDSVWEFDLKSRKGKKLDLPGAKFANDTTIVDGTLYVSDTFGDQLFSVKPAEFLNSTSKATIAWAGRSINPNGICPGPNGTLLVVGFADKDHPLGIYSMTPGQEPKSVSQPIGMLDGVYRMDNGDLLVTDWVSGSLFVWNSKMGMQKLAEGFEGPADFAVVPDAQGLLVAVPDLVKSEVRLIQLAR